jgi:hypothetical protein
MRLYITVRRAWPWNLAEGFIEVIEFRIRFSMLVEFGGKGGL